MDEHRPFHAQDLLIGLLFLARMTFTDHSFSTLCFCYCAAFSCCCSIFEIVLMVALPGKPFRANPTATGHVPVYKANGMLCYLVTLATLCLLISTERFELFFVFLCCRAWVGRQP